MNPSSLPYRSTSPGADALGQSDAFLLFQERLSRVAPLNRPVLLMGERGTGKELAAARLHYLSQRWQEPLIALNCAALTPTLIESELFGHERGAFTGAFQTRKGRFESADNGTLFLDEIGSIPLEVQEKILRVVEYGSFERVGGASPIEVDVRLIGATHADLPVLADQGRFKRDLLDRLSFEVLFLPPLRERTGDIPILAAHFAAKMAVEMGREEVPSFSAAAMERLNRYSWPGNIRELKNVVERAVYRSQSVAIQAVDFNPFHPPWADREADTERPRATAEEKQAPEPPDFTRLPLKTAMRRLERHMLRQALAASRYNQKKAADRLGLTYDQLRGLYRKHPDL